MKRSLYQEQLAESGAELAAAIGHLEFSRDSVSDALNSASSVEWGAEVLEKVEAFTSRFARVVDLLIHRVFRSIDYYEFQEPGSLLDVANRAEARGLIASVDWLRELKDARNRIAHDYTGEQLPDLLSFCQSQLEPLLKTCKDTQAYIEQLI